MTSSLATPSNSSMTATEEEIILHIYKNNYKSLEVLYVISESSLSGYFPKE